MEGITSPKDDGDYSTKINNSRISAPKVLAYIQARPIDKLSIGLDMLHAFEQDRFQPNVKTGLLYMVKEKFLLIQYSILNPATISTKTGNCH